MMDLSNELLRSARQFVQSYRRRYKKRHPGKTAWGYQGWRLIGDGHYSQVFNHDEHPGIVLKLSGPAGYGMNSLRGVVGTMYPLQNKPIKDAWPIYARHCQANPHPQLPKILHLEPLSQSLTWAIMPHYESIIGCTEEWDVQFEMWLNGGEPCPEWLWPVENMVSTLGVWLDIHEGNVMRDPVSGEVILTDPFSY